VCLIHIVAIGRPASLLRARVLGPSGTLSGERTVEGERALNRGCGVGGVEGLWVKENDPNDQAAPVLAGGEKAGVGALE
jgi:hypothetical protein